MSTPTPRREPGLAALLAWYTLVRLGMLAVLAGLLVLAGVPLLVALLVGLVLALPLSMILFRGLRGRLERALAESGRRRSAERARLRAGLRGDEPDLADEPDPADPARSEQRAPDPAEAEAQRGQDRPPQE